MSKNISLKVPSPVRRSPVAVAMQRRYAGKGGPMKNRAEKRSAQKARRAEANA